MPLPIEDLWAVSPEIWLAGLGLLLLVLDLFVPSGRKAIVGWAAAAGLTLGLVPILGLVGVTPRTVFFGTYVVDGFAIFFKIVAVASTVLVILSAMDVLRGQTQFEGEMYILLTFTALGLSLMAGSADLIMVVLSIEFVSLCSYVMAGYFKADRRGNEAGL
ncbi:MAG: NADH-quinone oxidoreductase subunit N, partial [Armatimonadota bacterium]|nr:NADH-quinone oxidoreductase subunit N [Armatimonadota bacterium]